LRSAARMEAKVWRMIPRHKNIVAILEIFEEADSLYLVMERCDCHVLRRLSHGFRMKQMVPVFQQMLIGIAHVHSANIVHRDIKLENFLCSGTNLESIKLCDFGFAIVLPASGSLTGVYGTPPYMSPEMLANAHDAKTDVWSMGVLCHFVLSGGKFPYEPMERTSAAMKKVVSDGAQLVDFEAPRNVTLEAKQFTMTLLDREKSTRPTALEALQHPLFCKVGRAHSPTPSEQSTVASERDVAFSGGGDPSPTPSELDIAPTPAINVLAKQKSVPPMLASKGHFAFHR